VTGKSLMLAAGGTGGHLFPALALAQELQRRGWQVDLITDMRGDRYGTGFPARHVYRIPAATLTGRSPLAVAKLGLTLIRGVWAALRVLSRARPAAIAGFGGYPSFAPLIAARLRGVPVLLHEQNAVLGRANRVLQHLASVIALSFENTRYVPAGARSRVRIAGNPVRDAVIAAGSKPYRAPANTGPFRLLVFGGSQGARYFSETVPPALKALPPRQRERLRVVQQCREEDLERVRARYDAAGIRADLATFFSDLPERVADAHLVICRAGASTVAELAVLGRPALLVPYSHALDNDQLENATRLHEAGGAWCLTERELTPDVLSREIQRLMVAPQKLSEAAAAARACGRPDAVARLAGELETLAQGGR
jgi:UDP-N-acetylglucosamine--N-acetylmuramyl-(pentapeptide) pyrophosphoryl-undecaprenol N-acetylglucosamine transferase